MNVQPVRDVRCFVIALTCDVGGVVLISRLLLIMTVVRSQTELLNYVIRLETLSPLCTSSMLLG